jgi:hypothetical protein
LRSNHGCGATPGQRRSTSASMLTGSNAAAVIAFTRAASSGRNRRSVTSGVIAHSSEWAGR